MEHAITNKFELQENKGDPNGRLYFIKGNYHPSGLLSREIALRQSRQNGTEEKKKESTPEEKDKKGKNSLAYLKKLTIKTKMNSPKGRGRKSLKIKGWSPDTKVTLLKWKL